MTFDRYNAREAEPRWQKIWDDRGIFKPPTTTRARYYVFKLSVGLASMAA